MRVRNIVVMNMDTIQEYLQEVCLKVLMNCNMVLLKYVVWFLLIVLSKSITFHTNGLEYSRIDKVTLKSSMIISSINQFKKSYLKMFGVILVRCTANKKVLFILRTMKWSIINK